MKASELIKNLNDLIKRYGDKDVVYAIDEEGNGFELILMTPSPGEYKDGEFEPTIERSKINSFCVN